MTHRKWLQSILQKAATHFSVTLQGTPIFGWNDRTIGAKVYKGNVKYWLRVVTEQYYWAKGDWWVGNEAANQIKGILKPEVVDSWEWEQAEKKCKAVLMTYIKGEVCSKTPELRIWVALPQQWWVALRDSLDMLARLPTNRIITTQEKVNHRLHIYYGDEVDTTITQWETAHGDMHWGNIFSPRFCLLDWEGWGLAPKGYDAATLYCYSLLVPNVAKQVYDTFADKLDTVDGIKAQLYVITRLIRRIDQGDASELAIPLRQHAAVLLKRYKRLIK